MKSNSGIEKILYTIAIIVSCAMSLWTMPIARAIPIFVVLAAIYTIASFIYRKTSFYTTTGQWALCIGFVMMTIFATLNIQQSTIHLGSIDNPFFIHDAHTFYHLSCDISNNTVDEHSPITPYWGYPLFLALYRLLGINDIAYPIVFNIFLLLCTLILVGRCTYTTLDNKYPKTANIAGYAMLLTAMIPGVMATGTTLAKEPFVITSMLLCIVSLQAIKLHQRTWRHAVLFIIGLMTLSLCRTTYIYILCIFAMAIMCHRFSRNDIVSSVAILVILLLFTQIGTQCSWWGNGQYVADYIRQDGFPLIFYGASQQPMQQIFDGYNSYSIWQQLLLLPITTTIQFFIPFPFETAQPEFGQPISTTYHRMSYMWYIVALPIIYYYIFIWWRKKSSTALSLIATASLIAYCIPAFITAGSVSRYAFCFAPMLAIMGSYTIHLLCFDNAQRKRFFIFATIYIVLLGIGLYIGAHPYLIIGALT